MKIEIYQKKKDGTLSYQVFQENENTFSFSEKKTEDGLRKLYWRIYTSKLEEEYDPSTTKIEIDGADLEYIYARLKAKFDPKFFEKATEEMLDSVKRIKKLFSDSTEESTYP